MDNSEKRLTENPGGKNHGSLTVRRSQKVEGTLCVPGDKSISHRAVILGSMAEGKSRISGFLPSDDCLGTIEAFRKLGVHAKRSSDTDIRIDSPGFSGLREPGDILDFGNSGTAVRLMTGVLSPSSFFAVLTGDESLRSRPMGRVTDPLKTMGARIDGPQDGRNLPLAIRGSRLRGIHHVNTNKSAQVKSSLLLAGLNAEGPTSVEEPVPTRDHTERMIPFFGGTVRRDGTGSVTVLPGPLKGREISVPGDFSSAAFFIVLALINPDSRIRLENVGLNPTRTAFMKILDAMGVRSLGVKETASGTGTEPTGTLDVSFSEFNGIDIPAEWIPNAIDEIPALSVLAVFARGTTRIRGAAELRVKESDRIRSMCESLSAVGVSVEEFPDGLSIHGQGPEPRLSGGKVDSRNDHRIAMSMSVLGSRLPPGVTLSIEGTDFISTSFPGFGDLYNRITG